MMKHTYSVKTDSKKHLLFSEKGKLPWLFV